MRSLLERGRHQSEQYHYAKFRLVASSPEVLTASGSNSEWLRRLADLPAEVILKTATTFLWLNVHRLFRRIANTDFGMEFRREVDAMMLMAFDSFMALPEVRSVTLTHRTDRSLVLPRQGIEFEVDAGEPVALSTGAGAALLASNPSTGKRFTPVTARTIQERLWPDAFVLHAKNEELFENFYLHEVTGSAAKCGGYRERVLSALDDVAAVDRLLADSIKQEVRWFVPIGTTQDEHYFSFTSAMLKEVLFISLHQSADDLVEAIIHEYHHGALNYFMDAIRVFEASDDAIYYSSWKTEPRPLSGLFHGLFVFSACLEYYMKADTGDSTPRSRYRRARAEDIYYKLAVAARQVPRAHLTTEGSALAEACDAVRARALQHWPNLSGTVPAYIEEHAREWRERNPTLTFVE